MKVYILTLILATTFANAAERKNIMINTGISKRKIDSTAQFNLFVFLCAATLILVAGFRYNVGMDYQAYIESFEGKSSNWFNALLAWEEPGITFIGAVSKFLGGGPYLTMFLVAVVIVLFYITTLRKYSNDFTMAVALYILVGCWHGSFNGLRQYLAAGVLFAGHRFMFDRKLWKWALIVAIASLFHRTAIIMFPVYFIADGKLDWKRVLFIILASIVLLLSTDLLFSIMGELKDNKHLAEYDYAKNGVKALRVAVTFAPLALAISRGKEFFKDQENAFYIKMLIINAAFMLATSSSAYLARVGIYTEIYTVIGIPRLLKGMSSKNKNIWIVIIIALYAAYWWYDISTKSVLSNWHWIFD